MFSRQEHDIYSFTNFSEGKVVNGQWQGKRYDKFKKKPKIPVSNKSIIPKSHKRSM